MQRIRETRPNLAPLFAEHGRHEGAEQREYAHHREHDDQRTETPRDPETRELIDAQ